MSGVAVGAALLVASSLLSTMEVICVRLLEGHASNGQILLFRAGGQLALVSASIAFVGGLPILRTKRLSVHLIRAGLSAGSWWLYYASFQTLDLALATTLSFSSQIFVVILATLCLGERLTPRRLGATLLGLFGIAIAVRLWGVQSIDGRALYGLASALLGAVMLIITRSLSQTERTQTIMFYIGVIVFLAAVPQAALEWRSLAGHDLVLLLAMGLLGTSAMWLMVEAYRYAEASSLAPFPYFRLIFSAVAGSAFFSEVVRMETLVGASLIVGSVLLIISEAQKQATNLSGTRPRLISQWKKRLGNEQQ